jgi:hypothetical protein
MAGFALFRHCGSVEGWFRSVVKGLGYSEPKNFFKGSFDDRVPSFLIAKLKIQRRELTSFGLLEIKITQGTT